MINTNINSKNKRPRCRLRGNKAYAHSSKNSERNKCEDDVIKRLLYESDFTRINEEEIVDFDHKTETVSLPKNLNDLEEAEIQIRIDEQNRRVALALSELKDAKEQLSLWNSKLKELNLRKASLEQTAMVSPDVTILCDKLNPASRQNKTKVNLVSNFWDLKVTKQHYVYEYFVEISGIYDSNQIAPIPITNNARNQIRASFCQELVKAAISNDFFLDHDVGIVYDSANKLYASEQLFPNNEPKLLKVYWGQLSDEAINLFNDKDIDYFEINLQPLNPFDISVYFSNGNGEDYVKPDENVRQFIDLLTTQEALSCGFIVFGNGKLFNVDNSVQKVERGFEWTMGTDKGIKIIGTEENPKPSLLLDTKLSPFFISTTVDKFLVAHFGREPSLMWNRFKGDKIKYDNTYKRINNILCGLYVTDITNNMHYLIRSISTKSCSMMIHPKSPYQKLNLNKYYPAVKVANIDNKDEKIYLPMESLLIDKGQRVPLIKYNTKMRPINSIARAKGITDMFDKLNLGSNSHNDLLEKFDVVIEEKPKEISAFRGNTPRIIFGKTDSNVEKQSKTFNVNDLKLTEPANVETIVVVCSDVNLRKQVVYALSQKCEKVGVKVGRWELVDEPDLKDHSVFFKFMKQISEVFKNALVIFVNNSNHDLLKLAERRYCILTLQITPAVAKSLRYQRDTLNNIILKLNSKLGGLNYKVVPEGSIKNRWISNNEVLVISYDVCHPETGGELDAPSVIGISYNGGKHNEIFVGDFHYQEARKEEINADILRDRMKWMIGNCIKNRGVWPQSIIIIRDGVSEGQYDMVINRELRSIRDGCQEFSKTRGKNDWKPKFSLIITTKRNSARFFQKGSYQNPPPGTVIDDNVTRPNCNEIYIVSSHAKIGTAKAVSYQLLVDEVKFQNMDELQSFIIALTYHHQINNAPISIPEPVYQADEWAKRGKNLWKGYTQYFKKDNDLELLTEKLSYRNSPLDCIRLNA